MEQFLQLCKKNFIVKARSKKATAYEYCSSLYFLIIVIILVKLNQRQLTSYPALPTLPQAAPSPLGTPSFIKPLALPLTCLYYESASFCKSELSQVPSWYRLCIP
jgi:hypothetical protein